jgi:hypothetical protein
MPTLIKPLDSSSAYVYCPVCRDNGNPRSPLQRDSVGRISCSFGHAPAVLLEERPKGPLMEMDADAIKAVDLQPEIPLITDIKWPLFVQPEIKAKFEAKFKGRVMATISTMLMALVDNAIVIITGPDAIKLRKMGIKSGQEMLAYMESMKSIEKERDELASQVTKFMKLMQAANAE